MRKILILVPVIFLASASCKKEKGCDITVANISGTYKVITAIYYEPGMPPVDLLENSDECAKDDLLVLYDNGNYETKDTGTPLVCNPDNDDAGNWSLNGNILTIDGEAATIESFDCEKLVYSGSPGYTPGDNSVVTIQKQ